ncbi:sec-independent protein translocase protein TatC [Halogranum amylolyticum]|uniref:Sec-independent protein translocase protein TatC n=1 Tax=Halogranum amylolyticum TaxID=660520 RepID=A0A1H8QSE3_9EURY|nr:twin-arginine translocase subunit TatC [Halogranum amylolyticum]SEO56743.1 sec-independent protein translocase protein TatC [Halogranum amylolyticum]
MSSALDEDTRRTLDEGRATAGAMLRSAQKDGQKIFLVFLVGFLGAFYALQYAVWDFLWAVTESRMDAQTAGDVELIAQTPFDVILLQAKISMAAGLIIAAPAFIYFARDALRERGYWPQAPVATWKLVGIGLLSAVLFTLGLFYGYFLFFPLMFQFLAENAIAVDLAPRYSIVKWAQFIFLLTVSFGLAAQMPLAITALSYAEIVPYETFRDKWRYAVLAIFVFGAVFSPPDPFTQIMWAAPLLVLYGFSLYLAKIVVTARRGSEQTDFRAVAKTNWNVLAGVFAAAVAAAYLFYTRGGVARVNGYLDTSTIGGYTDYRLLPAADLLPLSPTANAVLVGAVLGLVVAGVALMYFVVSALGKSTESTGELGDPTGIDLRELDEAGVRAAPLEAFAALSESEALQIASEAIDDGDHTKAQAVLDRFDEAQKADVDGDESMVQTGEGGDEAGTAEGSAPGSIEDRATRAGGSFLSELTDGERDEDDIGGYYTDIMFIIESLTSKAFWVVGWFMLILGGTFTWLYSGGIGDVKTNFLDRLPAAVNPEALTVITLHPVEALIFEVKFSTLVAGVMTLPLVAFLAWPALRERKLVYGRRYVIFGWMGALLVGLVGGFAVGYLYVAPTVISFLVADAVAADMVISYRISDFFWLIFYTTAGIGLLADVPVLMVLLNTSGVSYRAMRGRWREVTVGILTFAAFFTPAGILTMFLVTIPLMAAYGLGLAVLYVITFGGRRDLARPRASDV